MSSPTGDLIKAALNALPVASKYSFDTCWEEIGKVLDLLLNNEAVGTIKMYAGAVMPDHFLLCDGRTIGKTGSGATLQGEEYHDLYDVIQNLYGGGAGPVWDDGDVVNIPDFQGIFPRGAGVSSTLTKASGAPFAGSTGHYENDKFQGHNIQGQYRNQAVTINANTMADTNTVMPGILDGTPNLAQISIPCIITDGVNGAPRTGDETNPANLAVPFIIRY